MADSAESSRHLRRTAFRTALHAIFVLATLPPSAAQESADEASPANPRAPGASATAASPATTQPQVQGDPWGRETPRGAVRGYLEAAREGRWSDAAAALDLSAEPRGSGEQLARELKFLLDQQLWVDLDAASDEVAGDLQDGLPVTRELLGVLDHTRNGRIELEREAGESGVAVWRFSASTLARVPALYDEFGPPAFVAGLPGALVDVRLLEVALWQWIGMIVLAVAAWLGAWVGATLIVRLLRPLTSRSRSNVDDRLLALLLGPARLLIGVAAFDVGVLALRLAVPAREFVHESSRFLAIAAVAWGALRIVDLLRTIGQERLLVRGRSEAAHLVPMGARAVKVAIMVLTVLGMLSAFGFDVTAVLAGLGVGGLAVALAAQKTVENIFGGVSVLVDQPVKPGEFCRFGEQVGTVEDIGLRSTRIRTLDRTVVSVPNADFSTLRLENFARRDRIRLIARLGLRYETTPDQLRHVIAKLREMLRAHPKVLPEPLRVRLVDFGASSIDLEAFGYVDTTDYDEFLGVREDIFLRVMDIVAASGTGFAFPSTTMYLARDAGLDRARQVAAEDEIGRLRADGRLPFPNPPRRADGADERLDWPPRGSVDDRS